MYHKLFTAFAFSAFMAVNAYAEIPRCNSSMALDVPCKGGHKAQDKRKEAIEKLYTTLIAPMPSEIMTHTKQGEKIVKSIFEVSETVSIKGRVTPAGKYDGLLGAEEYFWGLALSPFISVPYVNIKSLIASDDKVAVAVNIDFCLAGHDCSDLTSPFGKVLDSNGQLKAYTLTQTGFFTFNRRDRVIQYDLSIMNLGAISDPIPKEAVCAFLVLPPAQSGIPNSGNCTNFWNRQNQYPAGYTYTGGADPFSAYSNCVAFMNGHVPAGTWYRANSNTQVCRALHMILTPYRVMHCGHSGPKGLDVMPIVDANGNPVLDADGYPTYEEHEGKCVDFDYSTYYHEGF